MRAIRLTSAAALGLAALSLTAPAASAVGGKVSPLVGTATPSTIAAGGQVTLSLSGCDGDADASSAVFDVVRIPPGGTATATVDWDAKRGAMYTVTYTCDDGRQTTSQLTIAGDTRPTPTLTTLRPTVTATATATATRSPAGPARGGVGGSQDGLNAGEIAAGAALVVAATGGVVYVLRRRGGSRQH
ncbi:hypothetical protein AR457_04920 [Streptomyces agglomeratus]|uniref:Lipoprotein n=1 Tax=Streptomyces agglomeratus TaxID=285458 RepID=A0A1E5P2Z3_9ACTN|nr:hypothetical protein [Streptomyces agglomeratus]OEJ23933.1 hypothetical protein AS594_05035 [Streptomyces agglomeratus]OEJ43531.1 hypothetical protein AR457_04920 [Streptomyces agglomeratus]OEJ54551.1 hypothetical protein BGK72_30850 [Streptomyces agglomeratus]OEJ61922.1 hypothetical protein BGM19_31770 [Streptomyces agglomeratus]